MDYTRLLRPHAAVPCFIVDQRYAVIGAEAPEMIAEAIRLAVAEAVAS
jgi:predicted DsbA family dithiol-disulfide isomerase